VDIADEGEDVFQTNYYCSFQYLSLVFSSMFSDSLISLIRPSHSPHSAPLPPPSTAARDENSHQSGHLDPILPNHVRPQLYYIAHFRRRRRRRQLTRPPYPVPHRPSQSTHLSPFHQQPAMKSCIGLAISTPSSWK
jgi:hypothetical protein